MSVCINPGVNLRVQVHNLRTVGPLHVTLCMACIPSAEYYLMTLTSISWSTDFVKLHHLNLISGQGLAGATLPSDRFVVFFFKQEPPTKMDSNISISTFSPSSIRKFYVPSM